MKYVKDQIYGYVCVEHTKAACLGGHITEYDYDNPDWSVASFQKLKNTKIFIDWMMETPNDYVLHSDGISKTELGKYEFKFQCNDNETDE